MHYLYETHCHGSQCSRCATSTTQEMVRAYQAAGYAGMVLTDHFIYGNTAVSRSLPWDVRMHQYYDAFLEAREAARDLDFDVIFGFEHYYGAGKEALVYGVELDVLLAHPDIPKLPMGDFADLVHSVGGILIQAHPYRDRYYIDKTVVPRMDVMDGVEVYNAWNTREENLPSLSLVKSNDFILTSGGDTHSCMDAMIGAAGVLLPHRVSTTQEFAAALKENRHGFRLKFQDHWTVNENNLP